MKDTARLAAGIALAALLIWLVVRDVDSARLATAVARASILGLVLGATLNLAHNVFRVWRWRVLLSPVRPSLHFRPMFSAVILGYLTTWVLPGRLGELVRPALLSAREDVPIGPSLGSVLADRLLDGVAIVVLFAAGSFLSPLQGEAASQGARIRTTALALVGVVTVLLAFLTAASAFEEGISARVERRGRVVRWFGRAMLALAHGTVALRRPALLACVLGQSLLAWLTIALGTWIGVLSSGVRVPLTAILVLLPLLALGVAVPTPAGTGGYHAAMAFGLEMLFGVPKDAAVAAGILMHLAVVLPVFLLGGLMLRTERISWHDLVTAAREVRRLGAAPRKPGAASAMEELP